MRTEFPSNDVFAGACVTFTLALANTLLGKVRDPVAPDANYILLWDLIDSVGGSHCMGLRQKVDSQLRMSMLTSVFELHDASYAVGA